MIQKELEQLNSDSVVANTEWRGKYVEWFRKAFAEFTSTDVPEMDVVNVMAISTGVLITAFKEGCFVGAVRLPFVVYSEIRNKMEEQRAQN